MERKSKLQMIAVDKLQPHPQNPRKVIGDVTAHIRFSQQAKLIKRTFC